ncbi:MAG: helix-turn-helix domain-containing protein [Tetrasphaera sp.]
MTTSDGPAVPGGSDGLALLGLGEVTLTVYREMLLRPDQDLDALAARAGVDVARVREALDALAERALLRPSLTEGSTWRPISPEVALRRLVGEVEADLNERAATLSRLRDGVSEFVTTFREAREARLASQVERLDSRDSVVGMLEELSSAARDEILSMTTTRPAPRAIEQARDADAETLSRGVRARTISLEGYAADKAFLEQMAALAELGAEVRLAPTLPVRMLIFDRNVAVIAMDPDDPAAGAVVLRGKGVLTALVALFELQWAAARSPFDAIRPTDDFALSRMDHEVLRLLAQGLKDDAVARHLGVSVRTARRFIADLHERAGAASRFELGVKAKELGWL